jgi:hypothetical protein
LRGLQRNFFIIIIHLLFEEHERKRERKRKRKRKRKRRKKSPRHIFEE